MKPDTENLMSTDRMRMEIDDHAIQNLYTYLSHVGKNAYKDRYLLSNSIFAKSDLDRSQLDNYLAGKKIKRFSLLFKLKKILRYFAKSFGWLGVYWARGVAHRLSRQKFIPDPSKPLMIIDIPMRIENIIMNNDLVDCYFPRLEQRLQSSGVSYSYTLKFSRVGNPRQNFQAFRLLKRKKRPVLFDSQLFFIIDYLKMFKFILVYPFRVLREIGHLGFSREDCLLRNLLWETMDHTAVKNYARQLFGQCISRLNVPSIQCVSWYENQSRDKNFFKGLRAVAQKTWVYGAQLFNWPATLLNIHVDEYEQQFGLVPDRILVNGKYYLREESSLDFKIGPSFRYAQLFRAKVDVSGKKNLLVLMPFFEYEIDKMLTLIKEAGLSVDIFVKFHPETDGKKYRKRLNGNMKIVEENLYMLLNKVGCVIGKSNGALVEAASLGVPVVNLEIGPGLNHNFMPNFGKGIVWKNASSGNEIVQRINEFQESFLTDKEKILATAGQYREMLFCEPSDERIDAAFGLNEPGLFHS